MLKHSLREEKGRENCASCVSTAEEEVQLGQGLFVFRRLQILQPLTEWSIDFQL